jgi:hypothetical protein
MVCAVLAKRYANADAASQTPGGEVARAMR